MDNEQTTTATTQEENLLVEELMALKPEDLARIVTDGVQRVKEVKLQIEAFEKESKTIKITDHSDKAGFEKTKDFLSKVRPVRIDLVEEKKTAGKPIKKLFDGVSAIYKTCIGSLVNIEVPHKAEKADYENADKLRKENNRLAAEKIILDKVQKIIDAGLSYDPISGFYKNDRGIAVSRLDITNMPDEDFDKLTARAQQRKDEMVLEQQQAEEAKQRLSDRKNLLMVAGMTGGMNDTLVITKTETQEKFVITADQLSVDSENDFNAHRLAAEGIMTANLEYVDALKKRQEDIEIQNKQNLEKADKIRRDLAQLIQKKLENYGFKFQYGKTTEEGNFVFTNSQGSHTVNVGAALEDDTIVDNAIEIVQGYIDAEEFDKKERAKEDVYNSRKAKFLSIGFTPEFSKDAIANADEETFNKMLQDAKGIVKQAEDDKVDADKKEQERIKKEREDKEARQRVRSKNDIEAVDTLLGSFQDGMEGLSKHKFEIINDYVSTLEKEISAAINKFNASVAHLRPKP